MLHNQRFQRNNLSKREREALDRLSNNKEIVIKPADKGGATVILNAIDYVEEAKRQLDNEIYYKKVESDLTSEHEQLINQCLDTYKNNRELEQEIAKLLKPVKSRTPIFYMLPKIHKVNNPGRPVVSSVTSHTEKLSAYVDEFLRPLARKLQSYIRDTSDFITQLRVLGQLPARCYLATLDVSSLYTNVDIDEGLTIVERKQTRADQHLKLCHATLRKGLNSIISLSMVNITSKSREQLWGPEWHPTSPTFTWGDLKINLYTKHSGQTGS